MFSADDSFELSEEDFLQAALDIEKSCPETTSVAKRTSFELGIASTPSCNDTAKTLHTRCVSTPNISARDHLTSETPRNLSAEKLIGRVLFDRTGPARLNGDVTSSNVYKRDTPACIDVSVERVNRASIPDSDIPSRNAVSTSQQISSGDPSSCSKSIQDDLFSVGDLWTDADFTLDIGHSPSWKCGVDKPVSNDPVLHSVAVSVHSVAGQLSCDAPPVKAPRPDLNGARTTQLGARCLELLRVDDQKQKSRVVGSPDLPLTHVVPKLMSQPAMKHPVTAHTPDVLRVLNTPVKSHGMMETLTPQPMEKGVYPRPASLRTTRKRKFPGPAGKLPQLNSGESYDGVTNTKSDSPVMLTPSQVDVVCSQSVEAHFQDAPWLQMMSELETEARSFLPRFTVASVIRKAIKKQLPRGKVPVMCVLIDAINFQQTADASVLLRDQTGVIKGTLHHQLLKDYPDHFQTGTALVLRQIGVFSPSTRNHYLNITPNNIVRIYVKSSVGDTVATEELSKFTEDDFVVADTVTPPNQQQHGPMSPAALSIDATPNVLSSLPCTPNSLSVVQSFTPSASARHSVSRDYMSQTPGKQYTPISNRTVLPSPVCNRTVPQAPACNRTVPQLPACYRTESPACNRTVPQSPACIRTVSQSPACIRTVSQSPACNRTVPQSPACNRTVLKSPACNRKVPQSPACNRTVLQSQACNRTMAHTPSSDIAQQQKPDPGKVSRFNFKKLRTPSPHHPSDAANTVQNLDCSSSVTDHLGNDALDDLLTGLDHELSAEF